MPTEDLYGGSGYFKGSDAVISSSYQNLGKRGSMPELPLLLLFAGGIGLVLFYGLRR